jgi:hypothetical protein
MDTHRLLVAVRTGVAAATIWGLVSAALTRALMRAITLITDGTPDFTWSGSFVIAVVYIGALLPGAIALAYTARRWAWILFGGGIAFLAYGALVIGLDETAHAQGLTAGRWIALVALLAAMLAVYAGQVVLVHRTTRTWGWPGARSREPQTDPA